MDYGRMGAPKIGSNKPRHRDRDAKIAPKVTDAQREKKAELLKRMKAASAAAKSGSKPQ